MNYQWLFVLRFLPIVFLATTSLVLVASFDGLPEDYESWTAAEKYHFWELALTGEHQENTSKSPAEQSGHFPSPLGQLQFLTTDDFGPTFDRFRDDVPYAHAKRIRSVGGVGLVSWIPSSEAHEYTGFFATGTPHALVRMSYTKANDESGTTPGLSLKLFRSGMPSTNMLAMESLGGQSSGNIFEFDFSNHLAPADTAILRYVGHRFAQYSCPSTRTGLSEVAFSTEMILNMATTTTTTSNTTTPSVTDVYNTIHFPFRVVFRPNPVLRQQFASFSPEQSLFDTLTAIPVGTKLYDMYAIAAPPNQDMDMADLLETHVGHLELTRAFQPSVLGDNVLFFRHQKIEEDYGLRPNYDIPDAGAPRCPMGYS